MRNYPQATSHKNIIYTPNLFIQPKMWNSCWYIFEDVLFATGLHFIGTKQIWVNFHNFIQILLKASLTLCKRISKKKKKNFLFFFQCSWRSSWHFTAVIYCRFYVYVTVRARKKKMNFKMMIFSILLINVNTKLLCLFISRVFIWSNHKLLWWHLEAIGSHLGCSC